MKDVFSKNVPVSKLSKRDQRKVTNHLLSMVYESQKRMSRKKSTKISLPLPVDIGDGDSDFDF